MYNKVGVLLLKRGLHHRFFSNFKKFFKNSFFIKELWVMTFKYLLDTAIVWGVLRLCQ